MSSVPGAWSPASVAVDWVSSNLYVVDTLGQKIDIFDLEGDYHAIVMSSNLTAPTDIALDPKVTNRNWQCAKLCYNLMYCT